MDHFTFDQLRYLASKTTVDDRALNRTVWRSLTDALGQLPHDDVRMAELGAGTGSMLERLIDWGFFADLAPPGHRRSPVRAIRLDLIDNDRPSLDRARSRVPDLARSRGWDHAETTDGWRLRHSSIDLDVRFELTDVLALVRETTSRPYDILLAHAFLDLFHLPTALPPMLQIIAPGGLFYFTINYDGVTIFEPVVDRSLEDAVQASYNRAMDERLMAGQPSGDSHRGPPPLSYSCRVRSRRDRSR